MILIYLITIFNKTYFINKFYRQSLKETAKEEARVEQVDSMNRQIRELAFLVEKQDTQLREVVRLVADLGQKSLCILFYIEIYCLISLIYIHENFTDSRVVKKPSWPLKPAQENISNSLSKDIIEELSNSTVTNNSMVNRNNMQNNKSHNIVDKPLNYLEKDVWCKDNKEQNPGIIIRALQYIEKDLF